jgi:hypothetical protein
VFRDQLERNTAAEAARALDARRVACAATNPDTSANPEKCLMAWSTSSASFAAVDASGSATYDEASHTPRMCISRP